jgi:hypothetical protein
METVPNLNVAGIQLTSFAILEVYFSQLFQYGSTASISFELGFLHMIWLK